VTGLNNMVVVGLLRFDCERVEKHVRHVSLGLMIFFCFFFFLKSKV
jgi:hypothetical protein